MTTLPDETDVSRANPPASSVSTYGVNSVRHPFLRERGPVVNLVGTDVDPRPAGTLSLKVDRETVRAYLTEMYLDVPGYLQIWTTPAKGSGRFFETTEDGIEQAVTTIEADGNFDQQGIYARVTTLSQLPDVRQGQRGTIAMSSHFIALWTDLDFGTTGHAAGEKLPPDAGAAQAVYDASGLPEASITVNSGGGLYHIVKLSEPLDIRDAELRMRVSALSRRWQQRVKATAEKMGYAYGTGVSDLARVLRVPGTVNAKDWSNRRRAAFMSFGTRYTLEELEAACPAPPRPERRAVQLTGEPAKDARARFEHHLAEMRAATFERNNLLNKLAFMSFQYAGAGQLDPDEVEREFTAAALDSGLEEGEVRATVGSARAGLKQPFVWRDFTRPPAAPAPVEADDMWAGQVDGNGQITEPAMPAPAVQVAEEKQPPPPAPPAPPTTDGADGPPPPSAPVPVDITNERDGLHRLTEVINEGLLPEVYVRDGRLVHVGVVSGARNGRRKKIGAASERTAPDMTPSQLRALAARYCYTYAYNAKMEKISKLPTEALCKAVLSETEWPGLPDLVDITTMPFIREDGTVCQERGYDEETGTWLNVDAGFPEVPADPSPEQIAEAKSLLLGRLLRDFPFVGPADRANYMGLLMTPALKHVAGHVTPFGVITAAAAGSGKSLLAEIISRTYGGNGDAVTLSRQDEEIRKLITSKLMSDPHPVVTFDNIGKSHRVDSPVLAQLMTSPVWSDRVLGGNDVVSRINDKLWLGTGNNVQLGGEMASRSVLVRIDPKMERPDKRDTDKFVLGNLQTWMTVDSNRIQVMHALLVLIRSWAAAGMPQSKIDMRTFGPWARNVGGLLDFHGITGFMTNLDEVEEADEEAYEWAQFLSSWHERHQGEWMTTAQLLGSYHSTRFEISVGHADPWRGSFPLRDNGQPYTTKGMGMKLKYVVDRPIQGWVLRKQHDKSTNQQVWRPERMHDQTGPPPPSPQGEQMELAVPPQRDTPPPPAAPPVQRLHEVRSVVNSILPTVNRTINPTTHRSRDRQ